MTDEIVVVDDEQAIANLLTTFLQNEGYQVVTFYNGLDAFAYIKEYPVSLLVLDVMLPDKDGFSIL